MTSLKSMALPLLPPPFPSGWYVLAQSAEIKPRAVITRRFVGQDLVLFRTEEGRVVVIDPYCPHMGAHLGRGGKVIGDALRCPMHGFSFNHQGKCVLTPQGGRPPPAARTRTWPVREQNGLVLVFHDRQGAEPAWEVPVLNDDAFTAPLWERLSFRGHPQETSENSADLLHFAVVHGYQEVTQTHAAADGAEFHTRMTFRRRDFLGGSRTIPIEISVHVHGLGFSYVDAFVPKWGLKTRQFVLSTPTEADRVELRIGMAIGRDLRPAKVNPLLALMPLSMVLWIIGRVSMISYVRDVRQDVPLWENKAYVNPPALSEKDGPIGQYRRWARQFYGAGAQVSPLRAANAEDDNAGMIRSA